MEGLTNAGNVTMPKDAKTTGEEALFDTVAFGILVF